MSAARALDELPPAARAAALAALDEISRPMEVKEIDVTLARAGYPRSVRRPLIRALMADFDIIALSAKRCGD
jgi:hypothetical protein